MRAASYSLLVLKVQLGPGTGDMKHIGRGLALRVNDRDLNVAAEFGHGGTDVVKQSRTVLGNDLDQRAVLRVLVIGLHAGLNLYFRRSALPV